ncbi:CLUMA_CG018272, isoform A [Clunio marinus]|uniref:CLUMA_CG018272, isoform A n=1 Tax=Clunio marinus TaxID=568069 RepID=A0A1J1IZE8_9DIPT|nr:CLUMA_CG018272, isoform A [Clunio marinus]
MDNSQKVRHIPIFVEGRDEPVINTGHDSQTTSGNVPPNVNAPPQNNNTSAFASAESSSGPFQNHHNFGRAPMGFGGDMGFGQDMPMPSSSIFDRAKDFPVRDFFNMRSASPHRRSESPINVHHQPSHQNQHQSRGSPAPTPAGPQRQPTSQNQERSVPVQHQYEPKRASTPQRQQTPTQGVHQPSPPVEQPIPAQQKAIEDSITKIQKIQSSVLELMSRVEKYDGNNRKEYAFLDEMLTQNLLKLDDIDAEGKENIKNARREAIKCINSLISLLDAKNEAFKSQNEEKVNTEAANMEQDPPTQNGIINGTSKNSSYDNVTNVQQTPSNSSVNMTTDNNKKQDEVTAEASLEAKLQEAIQNQEMKVDEPQQQK